MSLSNIASFSARKPFIVIALWVVAIAISGALSSVYLESALGGGGQGSTKDLEFKLASMLQEKKMSELTSSTDDSSEASNQDSGSDNLLVVTSDKFQFPSEEYFKELNNFFIKIQSEIDNAGVDQKVGTLEDYQIIPSEDGSTIMIQAPFVSRGLVSPLIHITEEFSGNDFNFYFIGTATIEHTFAELAERDLVTGETIGISVALIILALVFGSVTSAFIPVIMAIVAIFVSIGMVSVVGQIVDLNDFVTNIMTMMGLAVGIDYCLFILSRYREERDSGVDKVQAIANTGSTAGRAVMFSGFTVVFAILGVFIIPEKTFHAFGVGTVLVVFVAVLAGITLLPAIIGLLGDKVNSFEVPKILTLSLYFIGFFIVVFTVGLGPVLLIVSGIVLLLLIIISIIKKKPSSGVTNPDSGTNQGGFWNTITLQVMKRPYVSMIIASGILIFLSYFYFDLEEGTSGISVLPDEEPVKIGFELLNEKFGFGQDAPTLIAVDADTSSEKISQSLTNLEKGISDYSGMNPPQLTIYDEVSYAEFLASIPGDPNGQDAVNSIKYLRNTLIPNAFEGVDPEEYTIYVGGSTAEIVDSVESVNESFPYVIGLVLLLSLLLLLFAFRSVTIPVASIVMNLLSVGASYGLLVLVFQKGFMIDIFGFEQVDQIEFWLPLFMFTILFGLSMDYHVFMLSRIKENFDETKSANESVAFGLRTTASIITGAALIMVAVFGGFALGDITFFQSMGFGLGAAVLIDATIVRSILVPSVMKILGESAWYLPSWLNWLPNISIEGNVKN